MSESEVDYQEYALGFQMAPGETLAGLLQRYEEVCGVSRAERRPRTFPDVLSFTLSMQQMTDASFPFPGLGMVHIENRITQQRPLRRTETLASVAHDFRTPLTSLVGRAALAQLQSELDKFQTKIQPNVNRGEFVYICRGLMDGLNVHDAPKAEEVAGYAFSTPLPGAIPSRS